MLDLIFDNLYQDFANLNNFGNMLPSIQKWISTGEGFASGYASIENSIQTDIENLKNIYN